ncbi:MAG: ATP-binding protein [Sphingomonadales bacterium]
MEQEWGFYGRSVEIREVQKILQAGRWFFCAISGRRRIGKTTLIREALAKEPDAWPFYFQVPDSDERGVVQAFWEALEDDEMPIEIVSQVRDFHGMARLIGALCSLGVVVVIDEFQYFHRKSLSPFTSYLQAEVDRLRDTAKGGLFVLGSIHTEMTAILEDQASPLFNRVTHRIEVDHWDFQTLFEMYESHGITDPYHVLFLWSLFEGVPKFYRDCFEHGVLRNAKNYRHDTLRLLFFEGSSPLKEEAANWFLRELRGRYDSVLKLLANKGPCSHRDLVSEYARAGSSDDKQLGAYLKALIERYRMVDKLKPVFAGDKSRKARYVIADNFLMSWLHAIARNVQATRIQPLPRPLKRADESLVNQEGYTFEKMVRLLTEECSRKAVGDFELSDFVRGYWNKPAGSTVEIDLVAYNDEERVLRLGSCKRAAKSHTGQALLDFEGHISKFLGTKEGRRFTGWNLEKVLYSPSFSNEFRKSANNNGYICRDLDDFRNFLAA